MKSLAVFLGLMVTGCLVVMVFLWSGESLIVLMLALLTVLAVLWIVQQRPWESRELPNAGDKSEPKDFSPATPKTDKNRASSTSALSSDHVAGSLGEDAGGSANVPPPPTKTSVHYAHNEADGPTATSRSNDSRDDRSLDQQLLDDLSPDRPTHSDPFELPNDQSHTEQSRDDESPDRRSLENNSLDRHPLDSDSHEAVTDDSSPFEDEASDERSAKPLNQAAGHLRERMFGRKQAVFDLEEKEADLRWWEGDDVEPGQSDTEDSASTTPPTRRRRRFRGSSAATKMRTTGKKETPLPPAGRSTREDKNLQPAVEGKWPGLSSDGNQLPPNPRTDTVQLKKVVTPPVPAPERIVDAQSHGHPSPNSPALNPRGSTYPAPQDDPGLNQPAASHSEPVGAAPASGTNPAVEIRPARANYDITCDKKGLSGVPEKQKAPQLWAWQQIDDMGLDVHPSTGLMTLRLGFPNLRNPSEPAYAWIEFGPDQDPDEVMDQARAGWRASKIPRSQFYRLSPEERTRQLSTFLTAKAIDTAKPSGDPQITFYEIREELIREGGLTQLSQTAQLADVLHQFGRLMEDNKIEPLSAHEVAELESLGLGSTLPELYWSLDWFMEQRGKRIAFVDQHRKEYLFGLLPAHLADHWDGQTVGGGTATIILDIP